MRASASLKTMPSSRSSTHQAHHPHHSHTDSLAKRIKQAYYAASRAGVTPIPMSLMMLRSLLWRALSLSPDAPPPTPSGPVHALAAIVVLPRDFPKLFISREALYAARPDAPPWLTSGVMLRRLPTAIRELTAWGLRRQSKLDAATGAVACAVLVNNVLHISECLCVPPDISTIIDAATMALTALPL